MLQELGECFPRPGWGGRGRGWDLKAFQNKTGVSESVSEGEEGGVASPFSFPERAGGGGESYTSRPTLAPPPPVPAPAPVQLRSQLGGTRRMDTKR